MSKSITVVFLGTPQFTVPVLRALADQYAVIGVVTAQDKPVGRKKVLTPSPVKVAAQQLNLTVIALEQITELQPDLCIVAAYNKIIPAQYLAVPRLGFLNIHPSLLPAYRGTSPVRSAILDGCTETGVSIMLLDAAMDHGPILAQERWSIPPGAYAPECEETLFHLGADLLMKTIPQHSAGTTPPTPQDHTQATFTKKFTREDGQLDWSQSAARIHDRIRALSDSPGTWTRWDGKMLNILHAHRITETTPAHPHGTVFLHGDQLAIACDDTALAIETLQLEGATRQTARDFINGRPQILGARLT